MDQFAATLVIGIAIGVPTYLVASGLTLIYGVMGVLNFAHGAFFMYGAFLATAIIGSTRPSAGLFIVSVIAAGAFCTALGVVCERIVFRRTFVDHYSGLLASFALLLFLTGVVEAYWGGTNPRAVATPSALAGSVGIGHANIPKYYFVLLVVGIVLAVAIHLTLARTWTGRRIRAVAADPLMAAALGIRAHRVAIMVFAVGSLLAGIAGGLMTPLEATDSSLAQTFILTAFAAILIGGVGSTTGALVASLALGLAQALTDAYASSLSPYIVYVIFGVSLLVFPNGFVNGFSRSAEPS
jgi:branched-chain amino acid transport system permease protein